MGCSRRACTLTTPQKHHDDDDDDEENDDTDTDDDEKDDSDDHSYDLARFRAFQDENDRGVSREGKGQSSYGKGEGWNNDDRERMAESKVKDVMKDVMGGRGLGRGYVARAV